MPLNLRQGARVGAYIVKKKLIDRARRFPLVLQLDPLFQCNLRCKGCGKVRYPADVLRNRLSVEECVGAARECGAPVVAIAGGEPLMHEEITAIVAALAAARFHIYLCTNGLLVERMLPRFRPSPYLTWSFHLDGFAERHDDIARKKGVFDTVVRAIRLVQEAGQRVATNTTIFEGDDPEDVRRFLDFLSSLDTDGMMISPAFGYEKVEDRSQYLRRDCATAFFRAILKERRKRRWNFNHSPYYLQFLEGRRQYPCSPWGNPTRNVLGWQRPCYLLEDGYAASFRELMEETEWERYGAGRDPRCADCMTHAGYEASAVCDLFSSPRKLIAGIVAG